MRPAIKTSLVRGGAIRCVGWQREAPASNGRAPARTPLVLLHGFTGTHRSWTPLAERLLGPDFQSVDRIIAPDLPGHGGSRIDRARLSMETASQALEDALNVHGVRQCHLHGYSLGGRFALYFALTRPHRVSRLSLEGASPGLPTEQERSKRRMSDAELAGSIVRKGLGRFIDDWEALPIFESQKALPTAIRNHQRRIRMSNDPYGLAASLRGMGSGSQPWLGRRLREIRVPVLLITGERDTKFTSIAKEMRARIPRSRLEIVPNAGHAVQLEQPMELARRLDGFFGHPDEKQARPDGREREGAPS